MPGDAYMMDYDPDSPARQRSPEDGARMALEPTVVSDPQWVSKKQPWTLHGWLYENVEPYRHFVQGKDRFLGN